MKKTINKCLVILVTSLVLFASCTKEPSDVRLDPKLSTSQLLNLTSDSAIVVGFIVAAGDGFSEKGVCYDLTENPTTASNKVAYTGDATTATFNVMLRDLDRLTTYHARAYGINGNTTVYGEDIVINTPAALPTLATIVVPVLANTTNNGVTATTAINITDDGGPHETANITKRGVVYALTANPTLTNSKTEEGTGSGTFNSLATKLLGNKTYYLKAYATNSIGTRYSNEVSFSTPIAYATCKTLTAEEITKTTATFTGVITYDGDGTISDQGFCYSENANPTIADTKVTVTPVNDTLTAEVTGLTKFTTYHVRSFVTNETGTNYGEDQSFTTLADILTWYIPGDYVEASYPGSSFANWSPGSSPFVMSTIAAGDQLEGYVYMANSSNNWKFATQPNWDGPNYGEGSTSGTLDASAGNINSPAGYYKLNANATNLTFTAVATVWGVIGSASPGGWGDETALTYSPTLQKWIGGMHLTAAEIKFRANHDWGYNYGSSTHDANLNAGGDNMPIAVEADYAITLDLSHPNEYTYSANNWGLIGSATPDGWNSDQNMTWSAANGVFTVTLNLVVGEIKFRANDSWDINLGGSLTALTQGGANIAIATAGNYTITLNPWTLVATVTQN